MTYGRSKLHKTTLAKDIYEKVASGTQKAIIVYDKFHALTRGDTIEMICLNSVGEVEEFSPKARRYVSHTINLPAAIPGTAPEYDKSALPADMVLVSITDECVDQED